MNRGLLAIAAAAAACGTDDTDLCKMPGDSEMPRAHVALDARIPSVTFQPARPSWIAMGPT